MAEQKWNPDAYVASASFVPALGRPVIDLLRPAPGMRVLDLGCGDGVLTAELASLGVEVVGVDSSPEMVAVATERGLDARVGDAHELDFHAEFDAVFSNAALHWMTAPQRVVAGVARALRPGGRFVGEFGGHGNIAGIGVASQAALRLRGLPAPGNPWYYPTAEEYRALLEAHGFTVASCELIPRPTPLPTGLTGWLETFGDALLFDVDPAERAQVRQEIAELAEPWLRDAAGGWTADYVRLRFSAALSA